MDGVTVLPFRILCRKYGASLVFSEMVHVDALAMGEHELDRIRSCKEERPFGIQLFGTSLQHIKKAVELVDGKCDVLDFNLGCPSPKVVKTGASSALLNNPAKIKKIMELLVSKSSVPVGAKMRLCGKKENTVKIAKIIEKAGASFITVHARTAKQGYSGTADWSWIKKVKDAVSIPVIGNGDVKDKESCERMLEQTGCDFVMVGRAAIGNPGVFAQILGKKAPEKTKLFEEFLALCKKQKYNDFNVIRMLSQQFTKGMQFGAQMRNAMSTAKTIPEIRRIFAKKP
jgi:tRNA-dihydrouridine synthase B